MNNVTTRGRAQLRDLGPAEGLYEVDYIIHAYAKSIKHIGQSPILRRIFTADIRSVNGYTLKNGDYRLERENEEVCTLRKTGALWECMIEAPHPEKGNLS